MWFFVKLSADFRRKINVVIVSFEGCQEALKLGYTWSGKMTVLLQYNREWYDATRARKGWLSGIVEVHRQARTPILKLVKTPSRKIPWWTHIPAFTVTHGEPSLMLLIKRISALSGAKQLKGKSGNRKLLWKDFGPISSLLNGHTGWRRNTEEKYLDRWSMTSDKVTVSLCKYVFWKWW